MKNVVAYCRVSTDHDDQVNSLESQKRFFNDYIKNNPEWNLVEIYADEGISGTNTKKRASFNKMIADAELGLIDLVLTKEISRFARNTLDSIFYTRKLKQLGVGVIFMNDNINTLDPDAELRLTIMSSIAQEESRKTSDRVKWGQKRRMEQGVVFGRNILGYHLENGVLTVNEEEAKTIRLIFHMYLNENMGATTIAKKLESMGIKTKNGNDSWSLINVYRILRNEKFVGDLLQKKTYTPDYLSHEKKYNRGEEEYVYLKDHHEAIIDRDTFDRVQIELQRRTTQTEEQKHRHSNRYPFSGKIVCGDCNTIYVSRKRKRKDGTTRKYWACGQKVKYGNVHELPTGRSVGCSSLAINEDILNNLTMQVMNSIVKDKDKIKTALVSNIQNALSAYENNNDDGMADLDKATGAVNAKKEKLIELYFAGGISQDDLKRMNEKYEAELLRIEKKKVQLEKSQRMMSGKNTLMERITAYIGEILSFQNFDDETYKNMLEKIVVHSKSEFDFHIKGILGESYNFRQDSISCLNIVHNCDSENPYVSRGFGFGTITAPMSASRSWGTWK